MSQIELEFYQPDELEFAKLRDVRSSVVDDIKERIEENEYNPSRPLRVVRQNGDLLVADGNHRLQALRELEYGNDIPCVVEERVDIHKLAVESNRDEDTYAEMDLFDYLDLISQLRDEHTQAEIGEKLGWSRSKVQDYVRLLNSVDAEIRDIARNHQEGRASDDDANASFAFTEGWFRNSGIYELTERWQRELMDWFCTEKNCNTSQNQVQNKAESLQDTQTKLSLVDELANPGVSDEELESLRESVINGAHTKDSLRSAIEKVNNEAKNQAHFGVDALDKLPELPENHIDCVVMDPPYGTDYKSHRDTENPEFGEDTDEMVTLIERVFDKVQRVAKANAHIYIFFPMNRYEHVKDVASNYFDVTEVPLIWVKNNHAPTRDAENGFNNMYAHKYESIFICRMPNGDERELNGSISQNVLEYDIPKKADRWHDSQKPIGLIKELITNSTGAKDTVMDPFAGSGSTLLAAKQQDRYYIGIEKDDTYEDRFKRELRGLKDE